MFGAGTVGEGAEIGICPGPDGAGEGVVGADIAGEGVFGGAAPATGTGSGVVVELGGSDPASVSIGVPAGCGEEVCESPDFSSIG